MIDMLHQSRGADERKGANFNWRQLNLKPQRGCEQRSSLRNDIIDKHEFSSCARL
jgi:hypothetical protein